MNGSTTLSAGNTREEYLSELREQRQKILALHTRISELKYELGKAQLTSTIWIVLFAVLVGFEVWRML